MDGRREWLQGFTTDALLMQYDSIEKALDEDDQAKGGKKMYEVREYGGWRGWADDIEAELDRRQANYHKIKW
jgi:hypothetical protein